MQSENQLNFVTYMYPARGIIKLSGRAVSSLGVAASTSTPACPLIRPETTVVPRRHLHPPRRYFSG